MMVLSKNKVYWFTGVCSTIGLFFLGFMMGLSLPWEYPECGMNPRPPEPPEVIRWSNNRNVGEILIYKCDRKEDALFKMIQMCSDNYLWVTLLEHRCSCSEHPLSLGDRSIMIPNTVPGVQQSHSFMCSDHENSSVQMIQVCTARKRWEKIQENKCVCSDDLPVTESANVFDLWSEHRSRGIDTLVYQMCMRSPESPLYRIILCDETFRWKIVGQNACECPLSPPPPRTTEEKVYESWSSGEEQSFAIGTTVTYHCTYNPKSAAFLTYQCDFTTVWTKTYEAIENCVPKYMLVPPKTLDNANSWCYNHGGRLFRFRYISDQDFFPGLFNLYPDQFDCSLEVYHVGISEGIRYQWLDKGGNFIPPSIIKNWWEPGYPKESRNECVILTKNFMLKNVPCTYEACFICEDQYCRMKKTPCFTLVKKRSIFENYIPSCTTISQEPVLINSELTFNSTIESLLSQKQGLLFCGGAYVAIAGGDRIWEYADGTMAGVFFWEIGEPNNFDNPNVVTHASSGFMTWKTAPKNVLACSVCEYTAEAI